MIVSVIVSPARLAFVYDDRLQPFIHRTAGPVVTRASHVEPSASGWTADLSPVNGPTLGPFTTRAEALAAEVDWLGRNLAQLLD